MENIKKDIKNNEFKNIYLIYGEEEFTKRNIKKMLAQAIVSPDDTMNMSRFEGKGINPKEIIDLAETLPFFSDRRLILMENTGYFKSPCDSIIEYLSDFTDTTFFVFVEEEVDKRGRMYKTVKERGYICECKHLNNDAIMKWILGKLGKENKKITRETMNFLLELLGSDMDKISKEVEKLMCYTLDKEVIEISDIEAICSPEITGKIFEMIDAMGNKNKERALELYYDLLVNKEPPMRILYMLSRQFNIMLQIKELSDKGISSKEMESKLKMAGFIISKNLKQLARFKIEDIKKALERAVAIEEDVKMGNIADKIAVEMVIIEFSN